MATAATPEDWVTLDRNGTITFAGTDAPTSVRLAVGQCCYDVWPGLGDQLRPMCDKALAEGQTVGVIEHPPGMICEVYVQRLDDNLLRVSWRSLTLNGIEETLRRLAARRAPQAEPRETRSVPAAPHAEPERFRPSLRLVS